MAQFLLIVKLLLELLPAIIAAIKGLESSMPEAGAGSTKLALIKTTLETAYTTGNNVVVTFEQAWPLIESVIAGAVGIFNKTGKFSK